MPRKTYDPKAGRRRPGTYDGAALKRLAEQIAQDAETRRHYRKDRQR